MVKPKAYVPDRGDVVWISLNPQAGHEQAGRRPAVVLSFAQYNGKSGFALFCPVTSKVKGYPFEEPLPSDTAITGVALTDQVKSLDWKARDIEMICTLPEDVVENILAKSRTLLA